MGGFTNFQLARHSHSVRGERPRLVRTGSMLAFCGIICLRKGGCCALTKSPRC
jgi:hypothetical protein